MADKMTKGEREGGANEAMGSKEAHNFLYPRHGRKHGDRDTKDVKKHGGRKAKR